jgi:hypothetical protein
MRQSSSRRLMGVALVLAMAALVLFWITRPDEERESQPRRDPELYALEQFRHYRWMPVDAKERVEQAVAKYRNKILDPEPILIAATLGKYTGIDRVYLHLLVFDECGDVTGFVVREEHHDPSGTSFVFDECYPVFTYLQPPGVADVLSVPVHIRDKDQRKDEERWANYCDNPSPTHAGESMGSGEVQRASGASATRWEDTLPPVWISIPEPNSVVISLHVYDRAGYRSNEVRLLDRLGLTGSHLELVIIR